MDYNQKYNENNLIYIILGVYSSSDCPIAHEFTSPSGIQVTSIQASNSMTSSGIVTYGESFTFTCAYANIARYSKIYNKWYYGDKVSGLSVCHSKSL